MKTTHSFVAAFASLALSASAFAQQQQGQVGVGQGQVGVGPAPVVNPDAYVTPFNLAFLAYRGYFKEQGIPSYNVFCQQYRTGQIDAQDVMEVAYFTGRLAPSFLDDGGYENALRLQLRGICRD